MLKKCALCLLLAFSLLTGPAAQARRYPEKEHLPVDYASMLPVTAFDETALLSALNELEGLCARNSRPEAARRNRDRVRELYRQILSELDALITKVSLSGVQYDASGGAAEEAALYLELSNQQTRLFDRCYQAFGKMALSPYRDILDENAGEGTAESLLGYQGLTEEDAALREEEDRLVQAYDQIMSKGISVTVEGGVWTEETLKSAPVDDGTCWAVSTALEEERNKEAGEIYRKLLQLRTATAKEAGWDGYAEYAYWNLYSRDYELEDAERLREAAKEYILPIQLRLLEEFSDQDLRALDVRSRKSGEEILDDIQPFIQDFDREMGKTFAFMRENHLYDIEWGEDKFYTGYTVGLPAYGSAMIFEQPNRDYRDYSDLVHEFGHFNETFHCARHDLWADFNIDVGEIHSQALELMFTGYAGKIFGEKYGEVYTNIILYNILDSILDGCLYDEFQTAAYAEPDMSVEELNRLFKRLSEEYGYTYDPGVEEDPSWVENAHNFQNPLYFISYATSALSALDLWFLYLDDPGQAKDIYLDLTVLSLSLPYREAAAEVGLRDIFEPETIPALAELLEDHLEGRDVTGRPGRFTADWAGYVPYVLALTFVVRMLCVRGRGPKWYREEKRRRDALDPWNVKQEKPPWEL